MASLAARRLWGEANIHSTHSPGTDRWMDGWTEGGAAAQRLRMTGGRNSGRRSLGHTRTLAMEDTSPAGTGVWGAQAGGGHRGCWLWGGGEGAGAAPRPPAPVCVLAPGAASARPCPLRPALGTDSAAGLTALRFWFISLPVGQGGWGSRGRAGQ